MDGVIGTSNSTGVVVDATAKKTIREVKSEVKRQAQLKKTEMVYGYGQEMVDLQTKLQSSASKLQNCNWTCVIDCADAATDLTTRAQCFDKCLCYQTAKVVPENAPVSLLTIEDLLMDPSFNQELMEDQLEYTYKAQETALKQVKKLGE